MTKQSELWWILFRAVAIPVILFLAAIGFFVLGESLTGRCPWW